ncbi:SIS domain-containing protein [Dongia sp.]|uniref:SIS domain-containing protein n=1 Tax=Dongia sp. TaxID=1977262 RepID=UPI0035B32B47
MNMRTPGPGLLALRAEMARQHRDALDSYHGNGQVAASIATALRNRRRLLLLGMGASHAVNRMVEISYRRLGIEAVSLPLSEQLYAPLDISGSVVIVTSQSGESIEVHRLFGSLKDHRDVFGLTLEGGSTLAQSCPSLIGRGGTERAFAATRSLLISLALHQRVLADLGSDPAPALSVLAAPETPDLSAALAALLSCNALVFSGRAMRGLAEAAALGAMELGRLPALALEGGQFRHGPLEILGKDVGVVLIKSDAATATLVDNIAAQCIAAGSPTILLDASGSPAPSGAIQILVRRAADVAAALALLPPAQSLIIELADARVDNVGTPLRSGKITREE